MSGFRVQQIFSVLGLGLSQERSDLSGKHPVNLWSCLLRLIEVNNLESVTQSFVAFQSDCPFSFFLSFWYVPVFLCLSSLPSFFLPSPFFLSHPTSMASVGLRALMKSLHCRLCPMGGPGLWQWSLEP